MNSKISSPLIYAYLFLITVVIGYDLIHEFDALSGAELFWHILLELIILLLSVSAIVYLLQKNIVEVQQKEQFLQELEEAKEQLKNTSDQLKIGKSNFIKLINWQFDEWGLSPGEKEIGLLILKGLSFEEISLIRNTSSRTARKQGASIYAKAKLKNRNEFAAWFLEDLL
ncbi:MAG: helix-turn-helix transcriptional regulator [Neptuniibacter sp.]